MELTIEDDKKQSISYFINKNIVLVAMLQLLYLDRYQTVWKVMLTLTIKPLLTMQKYKPIYNTLPPNTLQGASIS